MGQQMAPCGNNGSRKDNACLITRSDLFGGISMAIETISSNLDKINISQLVKYAIRYDVGTYIKRLGWILEINGVRDDVL